MKILWLVPFIHFILYFRPETDEFDYEMEEKARQGKHRSSNRMCFHPR